MPASQKKDRQRRSKGELTRETILDGALAVLARDGLRGVTHRAVAAEAGVQLSLTTYYFKDINALIEQAFDLFCERAKPTNEQIWTTLFDYMDRFSPAELRKKAVRERICIDLADMASDIILQGVKETPDGLAIEQVLLSSVQQAPNLRAMAAGHRQSLLNPLIRLCSLVNRKDPEIDAALLLDTMTRLEYEAILMDPKQVDRGHIVRLLRRQIGWALGLKRA